MQTHGYKRRAAAGYGSAGRKFATMPTLAAAAPADLSPVQERLRARMLHPLKWRAFTFGKLPSLALWRVRVRGLGAESCTVTMPYGYRTQNPFRSVYFAAQSGAAELSTGALALLHLEGQPRASMLVTQFDSKYHKKAAGTLRFVCEDGGAIREAVAGTMADGEPRTTVAYASATLPDGTLASEFWVTWSFRRK